MKKLVSKFDWKIIGTLALSCFFYIDSLAQDSSTVKIDGEPIGSWISRNWMWVAVGVVVLLLLIGVLSGGSSRKKTIIVREEGADGVVRTTTTETND